MNCPNCGARLNPAQSLGRMAKGKAKTLSAAERKRRAGRMAAAREKRWPATTVPPDKTPTAERS